MTKVGVIGLGMMGWTHLDCYARRDDVQVVAVSDKDPERLSGKQRAGGNIEGQAQGGFVLEGAQLYDEGLKLIADTLVDLVDVCLPTPLHVDYAIAALEAGKHVMVEKPVARTASDAQRLVEVAEQSPGLSMPGMCMRFWPGWDWLKRVIGEGRYGAPLSAHFHRVTSHPGGSFYRDGSQCGGALLDLHVHDTDFVKHCFGMPEAVFSRGYSRITSEPDHIMTQYLYGDGPMVSAEGGWTMCDGFGFQMRYTVNFERATAIYDLAQNEPLRVIESGKDPQPIELAPGMGYEYEIAYLIDCVARNQAPVTVSIRDAAESMQIVEAEKRSMAEGQPVTISPH